ncbi:hypothetical protein [Chryseobacterium sp. FH1]|uniref:hypothetical protein n=1 Tax=Chryseobacterium sp. FH1 TaxID=1233951 RepID=UPI0004E3663D|nr:hypothetical protein [Chryseobacterium sp. FH1]KFC19352.1 hypothetical protein IO90_08585 [Chryseobacterium sp. FH1]
MATIKDYLKTIKEIFTLGNAQMLKKMHNEIFEADVEKLTGRCNFLSAKKAISEIPVHKWTIFLNCLKYGLSPEDAIKCTDNIFIGAEKSPLSADDIFFFAQRYGKLETFINLKK